MLSRRMGWRECAGSAWVWGGWSEERRRGTTLWSRWRTRPRLDDQGKVAEEWRAESECSQLAHPVTLPRSSWSEQQQQQQ